MFAPQLLKLVNRLIDMTEKEVMLIKKMRITEANAITTEKEPLVILYQNCVDKIKVDQNIRNTLKVWDQFETMKERVDFLNDLNTEHERCIKRVERAQSSFVERMQEKALNVMQPVQNYNNRGYMVNRQRHYAKQGGGSLATLDQSL